jgi:hypothetical protein
MTRSEWAAEQVHPAPQAVERLRQPVRLVGEHPLRYTARVPRLTRVYPHPPHRTSGRSPRSTARDLVGIRVQSLLKRPRLGVRKRFGGGSSSGRACWPCSSLDPTSHPMTRRHATMARTLRTLLNRPSIWPGSPPRGCLVGHRINGAGMTPSGPCSINPGRPGDPLQALGHTRRSPDRGR